MFLEIIDNKVPLWYFQCFLDLQNRGNPIPDMRFLVQHVVHYT